MARPETLIPGNCYFTVNFYDNDLVLPMIETLVFVGQNDDPDHGRMWLFKEPDLPPGAEADGESDDSPVLFGFTDTQLRGILDFDGLMHEIRELAVDHPLHPIPSLPTEPAAADDFASLGPQIAAFLNDSEYAALTMTIRFTHDGLSLQRRNDGYALGLSGHPRRDPGEEARIRSLFASLGVQPIVDYLSNRGRVRLLDFPVAGERDEIDRLCRRVLAEVYSMRRGDELDYHFLRKSDVEPRA